MSLAAGIRTVFMLSCALMGTLPLRAEEAVVCKDLDEVLAEIRQLKTMIETGQAGRGTRPTRMRVNTNNAPFLGSKTAPVTVVEFTDYQCPFCQRFFLQTFPEFKMKYIDTGIVRFYSMDLPLAVHPNAFRAAEAARCAGDQGKFWQLHDRMQANPRNLEISDLVNYAQDLHLNVDEFRNCIATNKHKRAVEADAEKASSIGPPGTPMFVIARSGADEVEGEVVLGALTSSALDQKLQALEH